MWYKTAKNVQKLVNIEEPIVSSFALIGPHGEKLHTDKHRNSFYFDVASTDKYSNAYQIDIVMECGCEKDEAYIISMIIQHKQLGGLVYQNYWYFQDEELTYEVYFEIITRAIKVRDTIEGNRLNTVMLKPMIWHALHDIKGELEKPVDYTIHYLKQDHNINETRGKLMDNFVFLKPHRQIDVDEEKQLREPAQITKDFLTKGKKRKDLFGDESL